MLRARGECALLTFWRCTCSTRQFQRNFSPIQHVAFLASVLLVATYLARAGFKLNAKLDKRRRRRLARLAVIGSNGELQKSR